MPKTMREQLEESFEDAEEEQEAGGSVEDSEESLGDTEESGDPGKEAPVDDDAGVPEGDPEDKGDEQVPPKDDEPGDETPPEDLAAGQADVKPPVSWKPAVREHWGKLPAEVKAEVTRREAEIQRGLQQASGHRKVADEYLNTVRPFQGLMQSMGATPSQAIHTVLSTVAQLSQGTTNQKAEIVSKLISDYGVDVVSLDRILSGQQLAPEQQQESQYLDQKLQPIYDFMGQMDGAQQQQNENLGQQAASSLMEFAADPKNDFFEDVRTQMADYLEVAANSKRIMTLQEAYDRACQDSPDIRKIVAQRAAARKATPSGDELGRKRRAAASLSGSPNAGGKSVEGASLHDTISAQFEDQDAI